MQWRTGEVLSLTWRMWRWLVFAKNRECAKCAPVFWYNMRRQKHSCFDRLKRNLENFFCTSRQRRECALFGACSLPRLVQGFSRASLETRERIAPSFFSCETKQGQKKERERKWLVVINAVRFVIRPMCRIPNTSAKHVGTNCLVGEGIL